MSDPTRHQHGLSEFETALASLKPPLPQLDHDELMFQAGRASVLGRSSPLARVVWPATAACLACVCLVLGVSLVRQRSVPIDHTNPIAESFPIASDATAENKQEAAAPPESPAVTARSERDDRSIASAVRNVPPHLRGFGPPASNLELRNWLLVAGVSAWNETPAYALYRNPRGDASNSQSAPEKPSWKSLEKRYREAMSLSTGENL